MHDAHAVGVGQRFGDICAKRGAVVRIDAMLARQSRAECLTGHERHHVVQTSVRFTGIKQSDDAGMHEFRHERDLALETFRADTGGQIG